MNGPAGGMCSRPIRLRRQKTWKKGCRTARSGPVDERVDAAVARAIQEDVAIHAWRYAPGGRGGYSSPMPISIDRARTARGALAGAIAAAVWSAQSPLDIRVFGVPYSDEALLGKAVTSGPAAHAVGVGLHLGNGALFGAAYAHVAPRLPVAPWARGLLAGLVEHLATWPLTLVSDRYHPARDELPRLGATRAPSRRRRGATCSSASSSASSSGA